MKKWKYRPLTAWEEEEISKARDLIKFYRTGIKLMEMRIQILKDAPKEEYCRRLIAEPLEF